MNTAFAQISTDGSLSPAVDLTGPAFDIGPGLGRQAGGNLFHSFRRFDLRSGETATFSGPPDVDTIVSRVTGGQASSIDGAVRSTIPGAAFFFVNPAGLVLGPGAAFDVDGSLHLSTADQILMQDGTVFETGRAAEASLSIAPVESFGFLTDSPAPVLISGTGGTLSPGAASDHFAPAAGGDLTITAGSISLDADRPARAGQPYTQITSVGGRVVLRAVGSPGAVPLDPDAGQSAARGGSIHLANAASIRQLGGQGIVLRAGSITLDGESQVSSSGDSLRGAGPIEISATRFDLLGNGAVLTAEFAGRGSEDITIRADERILIEQNGPGANVTQRFLSGIANSGYLGSTGAAGGIVLSAPSVLVTGAAPGLSTTSFGEGDAGPVSITASENVTLRNLTLVTVSTGSGQAGSVTISAPAVLIENSELEAGAGLEFLPALSDRVSSGAFMRISGETVTLRNARISSASSNAGDAGSIEVSGHDVSLERSEVTSAARSRGRGGFVALTATGTLTLESSLVTAAARAEGDGGTVGLLAPVLTIGRSEVSTGTVSSAAAGNIVIGADDIVLRGSLVASDSGVFDRDSGERSRTTGAAGRIGLFADRTLAVDGSSVSSSAVDEGSGNLVWIQGGAIMLRNSAVFTDTIGSGDAGAIEIEGSSMTLEGSSVSSNNATAFLTDGSTLPPGSGAAGRIDVMLTDALRIAGPGAGLSSATGGAGDGGSVSIAADGVWMTEGARITLDSVGDGRAGSLTLDAGERLELRESAITTQSLRSDGGNVLIIARDRVHLIDGVVSTAVSGEGNGGNVTVDPRFILLTGSSAIVASAVGGDGGNIRLTIVGDGAFVPDAQSVVSASSQFGVDGSVEIVAPDQDPGASLRLLRADYRDPATLARTACGERGSGTRGRFVVQGDRNLSAYAGAGIDAAATTPRSHTAGGSASRTADAAGSRAQGRPVAMLCVR